MSPIITSPPRYSASANCQPISTHRTSPSSHTRFVEANWKASALAAEAPFWNRLLAMAIAASWAHGGGLQMKSADTVLAKGDAPGRYGNPSVSDTHHD